MGKLEVAAWKDESGLGKEVQKDGTREQKRVNIWVQEVAGSDAMTRKSSVEPEQEHWVRGGTVAKHLQS